jgi:hypothetical protein
VEEANICPVIPPELLFNVLPEIVLFVIVVNDRAKPALLVIKLLFTWSRLLGPKSLIAGLAAPSTPIILFPEMMRSVWLLSMMAEDFKDPLKPTVLSSIRGRVIGPFTESSCWIKLPAEQPVNEKVSWVVTSDPGLLARMAWKSWKNVDEVMLTPTVFPWK